MRRSRWLGLSAVALLLAFTFPVLAWLRQAQLHVDAHALADTSLQAFVVWTDNVIDGENGRIVQQMQMERWRAEQLAGEQLSAVSWGLVSSREQVGLIGDLPYSLRFAEFDHALAKALGFSSCDASLLHPTFGSGSLENQQFVASGETLSFSKARRTPFLDLFAESADVSAVRCVDTLTIGDYVVAVFPADVDAALLTRRIDTSERPIFGNGFRERIRMEPLVTLTRNAQLIQSRWLVSARAFLGALLLAVIGMLLVLDSIKNRQAYAIHVVHGAGAWDLAIRTSLRVMPAVSLGILLGILLAWYFIGPGPYWRTAWIADALTCWAAILTVCFLQAYAFTHHLASKSSMTDLLQGHWSTATSWVLLAAWAMVSAALVVVLGLFLSVANRLGELAAIDWGYQPDGLATVSIALPHAMDAEPFRSSVTSMLDAVRNVPGVQSATIVAPAPWRFRGLSNVKGDVVQGISAGPDLHRTLRLNRFRGADFADQHLSMPRMIMSQRMPAPHQQLLYPDAQVIAEFDGLRWDPFSAADPSIAITPITLQPDTRFELVFRPVSGATANMTTQIIPAIRTAFPDAALKGPEWVVDVISQRYAGLIALSRIGAIIVFMSLFSCLVMAGLNFAHLFDRKRREFAVRIALGASIWGALRSWRNQVVALALAGVLVGAAITMPVNRLVASTVVGYASVGVGSTLVAASSVLLLIVVSGITFGWLYIKRISLDRSLRP